MSVTIWHNPRCTKSRQTLQLLKDNGVEPDVRLYLDKPPSADELADAIGKLGGPLLTMMRPKEAEFKAAGLTKQSSDADLMSGMVAHPKLIERPIVFANGKAAIGRPPEAVLEIL